MAHIKWPAAMLVIAVISQSTAWVIWSLDAAVAEEADGYFRNEGVDEGYGGNWQARNCGFTMSGPWAKGVNVTFVPNPPEYEKDIDGYLEFYVYDDLVFGTIRANVSREHDSWQHQFAGILCDMNVGCPWYKGETKKFHDHIASMSTYIDKGTYHANVAIYNEDNLILFAEGQCTF